MFSTLSPTSSSADRSSSKTDPTDTTSSIWLLLAVAGALLLLLGLTVVIVRRRKLNRARDVALNRDRAPRPNDQRASGTGLAPYNAAVSNPMFAATYDTVQQMAQHDTEQQIGAAEQHGMSPYYSAVSNPMFAATYDTVQQMAQYDTVQQMGATEQHGMSSANAYETPVSALTEYDTVVHMKNVMGDPNQGPNYDAFPQLRSGVGIPAVGPSAHPNDQHSSIGRQLPNETMYDVAGASTMVLSQGDVVYESAA